MTIRKQSKSTPAEPAENSSLVMADAFEGLQVFSGMARAKQRLVAGVHAAMANEALSGRHFAVLSMLMARGALRQTDLVDCLSFDRTTIMHLVDDLERAGLVQRSRSSEDRPASVATTEAGRQWQRRIRPLIVAVEQKFLARLTPGERILFSELLGKLGAPQADET